MLKRIKKLVLAFTLAAGILPSAAFALDPQFSPEKQNKSADISLKSPLLLSDRIKPQDEEKTFQSDMCEEFRIAGSTEHTRRRSHDCFVDIGSKGGFGLQVNVEETKHGKEFGIGATLGIGFRW